MDVRNLLKASRSTSRRIDHPHAKYNSLGRITCIVCGIQIKSELTWNAHILSKSHKENALKGTDSLKRIHSHVQSNIGLKAPKIEIKQPVSSVNSNLVPSPAKPVNVDKRKSNEVVKAEEKIVETKTTENVNSIPEGFFDDPRRDAEARKVPFRDKLDAEMESFQKELGSLDQVSEQIVEDDAANTFVARNLQEIDKQMTMWEKIHILELEKEKTISRRKVFENSSSQLRSSNPFTDELISVKKEDVDDLLVGDRADSDDDELDELNDFRRKLGAR